MESQKTRRSQQLKKIYRRREEELAKGTQGIPVRQRRLPNTTQAKHEAAKPTPEELSSPHRTIRNLKFLLSEYQRLTPQLVQNCEALKDEVKRLATQKRDVSLGAQTAIQEIKLTKTELAKLQSLKEGLDSGPKVSKATRANRKASNRDGWRKTAYAKWYDAAKNDDPIKSADDMAGEIAQAHNAANRRHPREAGTVKNAIKGIKGMAIRDSTSGRDARM